MIFAEADVRAFMDCSGQIKSPDAMLYRHLIDEEYKELEEALRLEDPVETLDAILDSIWVLIGLGISMGLPIESGWREVARSNFAKVDPVSMTVQKNSYGKVMKPKGWTPPDLQTTITNHNKKYSNGNQTRPNPQQLTLFPFTSDPA